ncbi:MAG: riboflavin synthase [Planctomycetota bacterium]|jgi:riboflavin synthase
MFTGLVEGQGTIRGLTPEGDAIRLDVALPAEMADGLGIGDSVAINGCCLTVIEVNADVAAFQAGTETLSKTNLGRLAEGHPVNLERSLPVDGRLGGHFVQGHVDGVGEVVSIDRDGEWVTMWFRVPEPLARLLVAKGSVAVDGISLTVVDVQADRFSVALIPHTLDVTTLGIRQVGDAINIETDILGKYVERLLAGRVDAD